MDRQQCLALRRIAGEMGLSMEGARQLVRKGIARLRRTGLGRQAA